MRSVPLVFLLFISIAVWEFGPNKSVALSCDSCGSECARACGTRHFRTCCFNYVRKRSPSFHPYPMNRGNFDALYGTYLDNEIKRKNFIENIEQTPRNSISSDNGGRIDRDSTDMRSHQNFYKPWKEAARLDNEMIYDYEQQQQQLPPQNGAPVSSSSSSSSSSSVGQKQFGFDV